MAWGTTSCGPVNFNTWNSLYPYNYASNYGGQSQFNVMPANLSPGQAFDIQNVFNPMYQFAKMMGGLNNMMNSSSNMPQMLMNQAAGMQGANMGDSIYNRVTAQMESAKISSLKSQLENALKSDKLTDVQKKQLEVKLEEVKNIERRFEELASLQQRGASQDQIGVSLAAIASDINKLSGESKKLAEKIAEELKAVGVTTEENDDTPDGDDPVVDDKTAAEIARTKRKESRTICDAFADSIDGLGTKNRDFKTSLDAINSDNVIEVMQQWDKTYSKEYGGETFMETFLWDANHKQKRDYGKYILEQLTERAESAGVDIDAEAAKIRHELNDFWISNDISVNYDEIINKIVKAETAKK